MSPKSMSCPGSRPRRRPRPLSLPTALLAAVAPPASAFRRPPVFPRAAAFLLPAHRHLPLAVQKDKTPGRPPCGVRGRRLRANYLDGLGGGSPDPGPGTVGGDDVDEAEILRTAASLPEESAGASASSRAGGMTPEVNAWTRLMSYGTSAVLRRPEMTKEEGMGAVFQDLLDLTGEDNEQIELYWDEILPLVSYLGTSNVVRVRDALRVAFRAHRGQMRKSGEPFVIHPVEVCKLLASLRIDSEAVVAGLLHDTVEDTDLTFTQVEALFGETVRTIVEGETKVSKLPSIAFTDYADEQAENLRQMFVAMTDDYRIIIVKLADRLHNMRTLAHMKPEKQQKISRETLDIFAPLAHRMGIWQFKSELEDTAFMYLYPSEYKLVNRLLRRQQTRLRDILDKSTDILKRTLGQDSTLKEQRMKITVSGRTKELYSLWHKMEMNGHRSLSQVADVVAVRVILGSAEGPDGPDGDERGVWLCYHVLGLVQHLPGFQPVPTRVKDYISFPKPNGYQSLHTALMMNGQTVEVQIRTAAMHRVAEYGMASHWAYKGGRRGLAEAYNTPWLASIKEWQADAISSRDFVECVRRELLGKRVFVFLRNGKILNLARGATVIDAAFQIHTEVGMKMHGVEINGKPVPLSYELQNGDVVSIQTGEGKPSTEWMRYAKSRSTRAKIRSYFRLKQKESLLEAGNIIVKDFLEKHAELILDASFVDDPVPLTIGGIAALDSFRLTRFTRIEDMCIEIGRRHDRDYVRQVMSKILKMPLSVVREAEMRRPSEIERRSSSLYAVIRENREAAQAAEDASRTQDFDVDDADAEDDDPGVEAATVSVSEKIIGEDMGASLYDGDVEIANTESLCKTCLPVWGDDILGTRSGGDAEADTIVHRRCCSNAQEALESALRKETVLANAAMSVKKSRTTGGLVGPLSGTSTSNLTEYVENSVGDGAPSLGIGINGGFVFPADEPNGADQERGHVHSRKVRRRDFHFGEQEVVSLAWGARSAELTFMAEVSVYANDRKLLLADCGEVVSTEAEILKTRSSTVDGVASFDFLVKVMDLMHLEKLIENLRQIESVTIVERKIGADIL
eukprot:CAMPEP_0194320898 /NCGR_PEP_ID=MMETSP0171-20130528/17161_1 /TAXON_ID=218684 /ORGANISM="Corethron pennatum, Strain L29A3" /LENGTH=1078 /DNA_ID=CAMNT_0039078599 /DNA_START=434 /DNA_END=3670 /DNA_ORIENTATION=-